MAIYTPPKSFIFGVRRWGQAKERKAQRLASSKANKEARDEKLYRTRYNGAKDNIEAANLFMLLGIDYFKTPKDQLASIVRDRFNGKRADSIQTRAMDFLTDNFDAEIKVEDFRPTIRFLLPRAEEEGEDRPMQLYSVLAERTGQTRKVVKEVYEALVLEARKSLRTNRLFKLPDIGRLKIQYRAAKEKRRGINPFTQKKMWFKAKPATNKLRFAPAKVFKLFVANKIDVVAPKKKHKKSK